MSGTDDQCTRIYNNREGGPGESCVMYIGSIDRTHPSESGPGESCVMYIGSIDRTQLSTTGSLGGTGNVNQTVIKSDHM